MSTDAALLQLNGVSVEVRHKAIKHVHLSVYPPDGAVRVSAPNGMELGNIRLFVISKLGWIRQQQRKFRQQTREAPREYLGWESHYFRGKRYLLEIVEREARPEVTLFHNKMVLQVRPGTGQAKKQQILTEWYREQLKQQLVLLIAHWEKELGVSVANCTVRRMKTRWGSCSPASRSILVNLELIKKPPECLEYIVVHELAHLIEQNHTPCFWNIVRAQLTGMEKSKAWLQKHGALLQEDI